MNVGEKVVCIDDKFPNEEGLDSIYKQWISEGDIYTVRRKEGSLTPGVVRVLLEEVKNDPHFFEELGGVTEPGFSMKRFIPYSEFILSNAVSESVEVEAVCEY